VSQFSDWAKGWATGYVSATDSSLPHSVNTSSGAHATVSPGHEADHSPSSSAEVRNARTYTSTPR
jgi:hypothetical protein